MFDSPGPVDVRPRLDRVASERDRDAMTVGQRRAVISSFEMDVQNPQVDT